MHELYGKMRDGRIRPFHRVVIETTGLADPGPVAQTFFLDDKIAGHFRLDAIVTLVDAKHILLHLDDAPECAEQIAFADIIVLNKSDLVDEAQLNDLEHRIRHVNRLTKILRAERADVPVGELLNQKAFEPSDKWQIQPEIELLPVAAHQHEHCGPDCDHDHGHHDHEATDDHGAEQLSRHDNTVSSVGIEVEGECDANRLNAWLGDLLMDKGADIFRMKGVLAIKGQPVRFVFQGVHMLFDGEPDRPWKIGETKVNRMIFIGRNLDREVLNAGFRSCLAKAR
jgi:G3E family GTPase